MASVSQRLKERSQQTSPQREKSKVESILIHRSVSKHSRRFQNTKPLVRHPPFTANKALQAKLYQHVWKINLVIALRLCLSVTTAVRGTVVLE